MYYGGLTTSEVVYVTKDHLTDDGAFVYRAVVGESQSVALPRLFYGDLIRYAEDKEGPLFGLADNQASRMLMNQWYREATIKTGVLIGTTLRDLRTSGIRHFFEASNDLQLTKQYAGVGNDKKRLA